MQAIHDILYHNWNISQVSKTSSQLNTGTSSIGHWFQYDHLEFPGVVPRTFLGPLFISFFAAPFIFFLRLLSLNKFWAQYIGTIKRSPTQAGIWLFLLSVRTILALTVILSFRKLSQTLEKQFGSRWLQWFIAITVTQSHFMFYMSRPLPNIMALPLGNTG